jgi:hypothetical protein
MHLCGVNESMTLFWVVLMSGKKSIKIIKQGKIAKKKKSKEECYRLFSKLFKKCRNLLIGQV